MVRWRQSTHGGWGAHPCRTGGCRAGPLPQLLRKGMTLLEGTDRSWFGFVSRLHTHCCIAPTGPTYSSHLERQIQTEFWCFAEGLDRSSKQKRSVSPGRQKRFYRQLALFVKCTTSLVGKSPWSIFITFLKIIFSSVQFKVMIVYFHIRSYKSINSDWQ